MNAAATFEALADLIEWLRNLRTLHVVWIGLALLSLALLLMLVTRWGESKPVGKCLLLSLLGHCLLGAYATTVIVAQDAVTKPDEAAFRIERVELADSHSPAETPAQPAAVWDRFVQRGPIEPVPLQTPRPDVPQAPEMRHAPRQAELPQDAPQAEVPLRSAALPSPGQLVRSEARTEEVPAGPVEADTPAATAEAPGQTPLPGMRETRLRPGVQTPQPARRRVSPPSPATTNLADRQLQFPRRLASPRVSPNAALVDTADAPSRRGGGDPASAAPPQLVDGPKESDSTSASTRPAVPASPSLRRRPGTSGLPGPALSRRARAPAGALSNAVPPTPSRFPLAGRSRELPPNPALRATGTARNTVPFRNRARVPAAFRLRTAPNRSELAIRRGGTAQSERAVEDALKWLVAHQSRDGRWDADGFAYNCPAQDRCGGPAGQEKRIDGQDRAAAGRSADTGITGLVLLALLGAGHTHQEGTYAEAVERGLEWLVAQQGADGNLAGPADSFAYMYCHGMATIALGEANGMTGDSWLREPLARAVEFIVNKQDAASGGWRYQQGGRGDTSVLGWQIMALKSAQLGGIYVPPRTWQQAQRFLQTVASGTNGGLASYRASEAVKPSMTAEALTCQQMLGREQTHPASAEAAQYLLRNRPAAQSYNLYYWYYGTLGMYHQGGPLWQQWNAAVRDLLVARQNMKNHAAGSWDPTSYWSAHGGRVYCTAMATLCLEVYYRYLPLYARPETSPLSAR